MSDQEKIIQNENGFVDVLDKLLEYQQKNGEKNTLIMLALLNLLEIVSGMNKGAKRENSLLGNMPFNPAMLLNLLGGGSGKGGGFDLASLMGLLGNFMGGASGGGWLPQPPRKNTDAQNSPVGKAAGKMKVERNVYKPESKSKSNSTANVKTKKGAQFSKQTGMEAQKQKNKKPDVIKWDFGNDKKE